MGTLGSKDISLSNLYLTTKSAFGKGFLSKRERLARSRCFHDVNGIHVYLGNPYYRYGRRRVNFRIVPFQNLILNQSKNLYVASARVQSFIFNLRFPILSYLYNCHINLIFPRLRRGVDTDLVWRCIDS